MVLIIHHFPVNVLVLSISGNESQKISDMKLLYLHGDVIEVIGLVLRKWSSAALDYWFFTEKSAEVQNLFVQVGENFVSNWSILLRGAFWTAHVLFSFEFEYDRPKGYSATVGGGGGGYPKMEFSFTVLWGARVGEGGLNRLLF